MKLKPNHVQRVSTRSRPKAAGPASPHRRRSQYVSTRSRPKAAGLKAVARFSATYSFNTQPPEGGWKGVGRDVHRLSCFNTQPPEGGWRGAGRGGQRRSRFNTQPPEGGWPQTKSAASCFLPFQHAAARRRLAANPADPRLPAGFNTQPPEGGWPVHNQIDEYRLKFQHAAARRRLGPRPLGRMLADAVSTRIRPKAAGCAAGTTLSVMIRFNTQPPEGGWPLLLRLPRMEQRFNTQPPEGGWRLGRVRLRKSKEFQHAAARRRLADNRYWLPDTP